MIVGAMVNWRRSGCNAGFRGALVGKGRMGGC